MAGLAIASRGWLQGFPNAVCVEDAHSSVNSRKGEEGSCLQIGGGSEKSVLLALEQAGGVEQEARRRWAMGNHCRPANNITICVPF